MCALRAAYAWPMERICPLLSLGVDGRTALSSADPDHRCGAIPGAAPLEGERQVRLCLTDAYPRCDRFQLRLAELRTGDTSRGEFVSTRLVIDAESSWRLLRSHPGQVGRGRLAAAGAALVFVGVGTAVAAGSFSPAASPSAPPPLVAGDTGAAAVSPSPPLVASFSATPSVTPSSTPVPLAALTPAPIASAMPSVPSVETRTYTVLLGDTLAAIAARYATTAAAIAAANGIENVNLIEPGQVLVIP